MKVTSKQADATLTKLANAMQRNTTLATGKGSTHSASPVSTYAPAPVQVRPQPQIPASAPQTASSARHTSGIRLRPDDLAKIRDIVQAALSLEEQISSSYAIRIALQAYDPKRLTAADIARIRATDGRSISARTTAS